MLARPKFLAAAAAVLLTMGLAPSARADDCDPVRQRVEELGGIEGTYVVSQVTDDYVGRSFPDRTFCAVIFRQWPIAVYRPEGSGLEESNVGVVQAGTVSFITSTVELRDFFAAQLGPSPDEPTARDAASGWLRDHPARQWCGCYRPMVRDAASSWLRLSEELKQDMFYTFAPPTVQYTPTPDGALVTGQVLVTAGGRGEIDVLMSFDAHGNLVDVQETSDVRPGVRPICQATKLLDRDPVVRRMAEQDLLVMGRAAKPYLDVRRAKAGPKLRRAIDRIWERILANER